MKQVLIILSVLVFVALAEQKRYDGYQVFEVTARDKASFDALVKLYEEGIGYDFWTEPRNIDRTMDIMVPPAYAEIFIDLLKVFRMDYRVKIADVQKVIEESRKDVAPRRRPSYRGASPRYAVGWTEYYDYPAIEKFVDEIAAAHPKLVTVTSAGKSYEGRNMPIVKISSGGTGKKAIFVDGGIHAREWISPAFTTWLIHELTENYAAHPEYVDKVDWYIMPVINPDGYQYTHAANGDRLWRKNRAPTSNTRCNGTDMNRNFGFHWDEGGSSDLPCAETYNGGSAFSEIESRNVRDAILAVASQVQVYLTFHSYGQYWLYPWGYTSDYPTDRPELDALAQSAVKNLTAVSGTKYTIGSSTNVLYIASGGSDDWAKGSAGIKYSYTVEMRDTTTFELPASQILPNNKEVWEAVKVVAQSLF